MLATGQANPYEVETQYYQAAMGIIIEYVLPSWTYAYWDTIYTVLLNLHPPPPQFYLIYPPPPPPSFT